MTEIFGFETGIEVPTFVSLKAGGTLTVLLFILVLFMVAAGLLYFYLNMKRFNKKIVLFENLSGQGYQVTYKDRAKIVRVGDGGEELLWLRKKKVFRTAYGKKMGKNEYWFAVGQDGYWYNIVLGDLDAKMGMLDIEPIDRDMRYMHVAIRKNITERYRKLSVMDKYGTWIMGGLFFLIMVGSLWFLIDQIGDLIGEAGGLMKTAEELIKPLENIASKIDTICSGGSGVTPAGT